MKRSENGSVLVEAVVAIPVLIVLMMGIIALSWFIHELIAVENAAAVGARYAVVAGEKPDSFSQNYDSKFIAEVKDLVLGVIGSDSSIEVLEISVEPHNVGRCVSNDAYKVTVKARINLLYFVNGIGVYEFQRGAVMC